MFVVFASLVWFTNYTAGRLEQRQPFAGSQDGLADESANPVEITDSAADNFLRAMGATAAGQARN
jgi:hypothetical protein